LVQELESELLIYDLQTSKAFCLNETSAMVYQLCDGTKTIVEISDLMSRKLKTIVSEDFVRLALNELKKDNLLENSDELKDFFAGMSRREMVKKVGFASVIALPIISSVIAPSAAMTQSVAKLAINAACTAPLECQSGNCLNNTTCCQRTSVAATPPGTLIRTLSFACRFTQLDTQNQTCQGLAGTSCCSGISHALSCNTNAGVGTLSCVCA